MPNKFYFMQQRNLYTIFIYSIRLWKIWTIDWSTDRIDDVFEEFVGRFQSKDSFDALYSFQAEKGDKWRSYVRLAVDTIVRRL